jgi:hypothetical protein
MSTKKNRTKKVKEDKSVLSRRQASKRLLGEILVGFDEIRGHQHCSLSDLENLERQKWEELIPVIREEFELFLEENWLVGRDRKSDEKIRILPLIPEKTTAFNLINGRNTIGNMAKRFADQMDQGQGESFEYLKALILELIRLRICSFVNPVGD